MQLKLAALAPLAAVLALAAPSLDLASLPFTGHTLEARASQSVNATLGEYDGPFAAGGVWAEAYNKAKGLIEQMTIEEKVNLTTGFPGLCAGNTGSVVSVRPDKPLFPTLPRGYGLTDPFVRYAYISSLSLPLLPTLTATPGHQVSLSSGWPHRRATCSSCLAVPPGSDRGCRLGP